jgi:hypothetical protein
MQTGVLISPDDKSLQFTMSVKGVSTLAIEVLVFHSFNNCYRSPAHGFESFEQLIQRQTAQFFRLGTVETVNIKVLGRSWAAVQNIFENQSFFLLSVGIALGL